MSRVPRINIENALYYITSRGDHNEDIFKNAADYAAYMDLLRKCKGEHNFKLFAVCLLPNHLHLLIELTGEDTVSQIMHALNSNYTKHFNSKHKREGHLFQERYKMVLVEKAPNLLDVTAYIHLNPKVLNLVSDIIDYSYSSYPSYFYYPASKQNADLAVDMHEEIREVIGYLKGVAYKDFIQKVPADDMDKLGKVLAKKPVLGSDDFEGKVRLKAEQDKQKAEKVTSIGKDRVKLVKQFMVAGTITVLALSVLTGYLYVRSVRIKENFKREMNRTNAELAKKLTQAKERIYRGVEEKYQADMVSFDAMSKRLEIEKKKTKELEDKLRGQEMRE